MLYNIDCLITIISITIVISIGSIGECMYNSNRPVKWTEHPYVVRLHMTAPDPSIVGGFYNAKCTGVLVSRNRALTAANCVTDPWMERGLIPQILVQQLGKLKNKQTNKYETGWIVRPVAKATVLPDFALNPLSNMAMLYLRKHDFDGEDIGDEWTMEWAEISDEMPEKGQLVSMFGFEGLEDEDDQPVYLQQIWGVPIADVLSPNNTFTLFDIKSSTVQEGDSGAPVVDTNTGDLIGLFINAPKNQESADANHNIVTQVPLVFYLHGNLALIHKFIAYTDQQFDQYVQMMHRNVKKFGYSNKVRDEL